MRHINSEQKPCDVIIFTKTPVVNENKHVVTRTWSLANITDDKYKDIFNSILYSAIE
jgi:hypothetical protein